MRAVLCPFAVLDHQLQARVIYIYIYMYKHTWACTQELAGIELEIGNNINIYYLFLRVI